MALYAIDDLDDAWAATREFLTPLSVRRVAVLAVVVFFVGGTGMNPLGGSSGTGTAPEAGPGPGASLDAIQEFVAQNALAIGLIGGTLLAVVLGFVFVGALMEFVFVQSLRTDEVRFWDYARRYLGNGLRLFGFRLGLALLTVLPVLAFLGVGLTAIGAGSLTQTGGAALVLIGLLAVVVFVLVSLVDSFTTAFVVPVMLVRDSGVLDAWRAFWPTLTGQWKQYLAYAVAAFVLNVALGIVLFVAVAAAALVLLIPLGVVVAGTALLAPTVVAPVAIALGVLFVLGIVAVALVVQVPIRTYMRYYALLILGDTDGTLDPIPAIRARVRGDGRDPETI
ncbi:DUF7544 domain-containing protein [Halalkalicoccus jeotgali]|uniref:Glycerophosphoryl diester phosphodiesterase membrane domain-containing protein n=1 Tax=Halalkalicoccus jeotgali (strain DSM 18796 / CECT 7217 / JCM 14584 / KCTC 4019 / B3) TaxID=795797 RepID=D8J750_HALJB|nr:hypothetical protein [Halalkalicoccus jeotgali]ADJ16003.1 hypothetical protein HacjB3_13110 [Halalkalicoccus jeotgali B3]ELY38099.1 hypothetical protein C497_08314 [Halalkalicoccus jeotgali B3]